MTNNINKLTKAQLINLLKETEDRLQTKQQYYSTLDEKLIDLKVQYDTLNKAYAELRKHATNQNKTIQELQTQQPQQTYTLIINNSHQYNFPTQEACHSWMKNKLHSYKLLNTITTPTCKVAFIQAISKAKAKAATK